MSSACLVQHDAVRLEHRIDIAGRPAGVVRQRHRRAAPRRAAENVQVSDHASPNQAVAESAERVLDHCTVEEWVVCTHATSSSWGAMYTPRLRNAAGACTNASTRAARVLKGNHSRRNILDSTHAGAPRPSLAARYSASAARNTSHRSSPVLDGSPVSNADLVSTCSHRYSSRNSATNRHRRDSSEPASRAARSTRLSGWYFGLRRRSSTLMTVVHRPRLFGPRELKTTPREGS